MSTADPESAPRPAAAGDHVAPADFFGPQVVRAAFVLAAFGWGIGFYGPAIFLRQVVDRTGWPLALVSAAVSVHYLGGALVVAQLPRLHRRHGVGRVAVAGAMACTVGVLGWALAAAPWQLFAAALISGGGWVTMGAVAINALVAPWYERTRPLALARAYNGATVGGVIFPPLWVALIGAVGFAPAVGAVGAVMTVVVAWLARRVFAVTPASRGQRPDGDAPPATPLPPRPDDAAAAPAEAGSLWRRWRFRTLAAGMALSLFAQLGLLAHLYSLLVPVLGAVAAGWLMGAATGCAIAGRSLAARALGRGADRRRAVAVAIAVQTLGVLLLFFGGSALPWLLLGVVLIGSGIGNATSLPPLIAQREFAAAEVPRVVALIVAVSQATYAFAPAAFGLLLAATAGAAPAIGPEARAFLGAAAGVNLAAIGCYLAGRGRR